MTDNLQSRRILLIPPSQDNRGLIKEKVLKAFSSKAESHATNSMPSASSHTQLDQPTGAHSSIPERHTWICPLCSVELVSVGNRTKLSWTRSNHLRDRHPNVEPASSWSQVKTSRNLCCELQLTSPCCGMELPMVQCSITTT